MLAMKKGRDMTNCLVRHMELNLNGMKIFIARLGHKTRRSSCYPMAIRARLMDFVTTCRHWQTVGD